MEGLVNPMDRSTGVYPGLGEPQKDHAVTQIERFVGLCI